jgi:hypothetical protein
MKSRGGFFRAIARRAGGGNLKRQNIRAGSRDRDRMAEMGGRHSILIRSVLRLCKESQ